MYQASIDTEHSIRPLGGLERFFWLADETHPTHFITVAETIGHTTIEQWQMALDRVFQRTPLLSARIEEAPGQPARFLRTAHRSMPMRILSQRDFDWESVAAAEASQRFDPAAGPLGRATLLYGRDRSTLVLALHHAIADGVGATYFVRDILHAVAGDVLPPRRHIGTVEEIAEHALGRPLTMPESSDTAALSPPPPSPFIHGEVARVSALRFSRTLTEALRTRARKESSSVQAALCTALAEAGRSTEPSWSTTPVRVLSPVDLRPRIADGNDTLSACITAALTPIDPAGGSFWDLARACKEGLRPIEELEVIGMAVAALSHLGATAPDSPTLRAAMARDFDSHAMISNLGALNIPTSYGAGALTLEALWGPMVTNGAVDAQTIGATTVNGSLHLVHTSWTPKRGLLQGMAEVLAQAVAPEYDAEGCSSGYWSG